MILLYTYIYLGFICFLCFTILYIVITSKYFLKMEVKLLMRNETMGIATGSPIKVNGVLRWNTRDPPNGSIRDSSALRKFLQTENRKSKYLKRWTDLTIPIRKSDEPKTILYFNEFGGDKEFYFGEGVEPFIRAGCPFSNCLATSNRTLVKPQDADAIIWHQRSKNKKLPEKMSPHTRLVYFILESPAYLFLNLDNYNNIFNYTMTYMDHADILHPFGHIVAKENPNKDFKEINHASGKTKLAVWFVSNCNTHSHRERLVKTLKKYIDLDMYGACGTYKCNTHKFHNTENCYRMVEQQYKFHFSFENSLCKNYVSEKFFEAAKYDMVPVVYGVGPYDTVAPPKSYIDVLDFKNLKELADYLLYLDKNDTAYNEYFSWKNDYESSCQYREFKPPSYNKISWCQLCEKLHTDFTPQTYTQMQHFHELESHCFSADTPVLKKFIDGT